MQEIARRLVLRGDHPFGPQATDLKLEGIVPFDPPEPTVAPGLEGPPINIAELYASFGRDIQWDRKSTPNFAHALRMHRLIDSFNRAGATGERQISNAWPTA